MSSIPSSHPSEYGKNIAGIGGCARAPAVVRWGVRAPRQKEDEMQTILIWANGPWCDDELGMTIRVVDTPELRDAFRKAEERSQRIRGEVRLIPEPIPGEGADSFQDAVAFMGIEDLFED